MSSIFDKMLERLTDNYNKHPQSNISKLLKLVAKELDDIKVQLKKIEEWRDIDKAEGEVLNRIGYNVEQFRGQASDEIYRVLIKSKIARNRSNGTINKIIEVISMALGVEPKDIGIKEMYLDEFDPEPAAISVISVPIAKILEIGMTGSQFAKLIAQMTAAGVGVREIELYGTFLLSSQPDVIETDPDTGLADIDMTQGGELGMIYQPDKDIELPT